MAVIHLNEQGFEKLLSADGLAVVDFWADWCGPCKALAPTIDALAAQYDGKAVVAKVNIDEFQDLARQHRVMSIPTVVLFKDGKEITREVGLKPIEAFQAAIDAQL